jgi:hypothetical protein
LKQDPQFEASLKLGDMVNTLKSVNGTVLASRVFDIGMGALAMAESLGVDGFNEYNRLRSNMEANSGSISTLSLYNSYAEQAKKSVTDHATSARNLIVKISALWPVETSHIQVALKSLKTDANKSEVELATEIVGSYGDIAVQFLNLDADDIIKAQKTCGEFKKKHFSVDVSSGKAISAKMHKLLV